MNTRNALKIKRNDSPVTPSPSTSFFGAANSLGSSQGHAGNHFRASGLQSYCKDHSSRLSIPLMGMMLSVLPAWAILAFTLVCAFWALKLLLSMLVGKTVADNVLSCIIYDLLALPLSIILSMLRRRMNMKRLRSVQGSIFLPLMTFSLAQHASARYLFCATKRVVAQSILQKDFDPRHTNVQARFGKSVYLSSRRTEAPRENPGANAIITLKDAKLLRDKGFCTRRLSPNDIKESQNTPAEEDQSIWWGDANGEKFSTPSF